MSNVAPRYPREAMQAAKTWEAQGKPATYWILDPAPGAKCANCQDMRIVYLRFLSSHWSEVPPSTKLPVTWLDGDGQFHKGWRVVELTTGYPCPVCGGNPYTNKAQAYTKAPQAKPVKQPIRDLTKKLESPEEDDWRDI